MPCPSYHVPFCLQGVCPHSVYNQPTLLVGFPSCSAGKESTCSVADLGAISGLGRSPGEGKGYPLQYSGLENSTGSIVHEVAMSWTGLSDFHFTKIYKKGAHI
ncbi:unnamed protein product [Rangifer tarandus platyrhynchus]|uniref:Uncharacterized protein n=2 Tax=Rangifer tarandus platyrhynchus TaxID=3082113 RepID=A0AC59Z3P8_RANTA|nr:unnamed protein product [Rangifer tarandus platyrhynchus]